MKIVHLSADGVHGGAGRAAFRLHTGLLALGHESWMVVPANTPGEGANAVRYAPPRDLPARVARRLRARQIARAFAPYAAHIPAGFEPFSDDRSKHGAQLLDGLPRCDVLNLHWIPGFVDFAAVLSGAAARGLPVVWTLHDMAPFTGGCHYDAGCGRFAARCGACPQLGSPDEHDLARQVWTRKRDTLEALDGRHLRIVADSVWLAEEARRSSLFAKFPVTTIHYGLDTDVFEPLDKTFARQFLKIPPEARVVLFAAAGVTNRRKGLGLLVEALAGITDVSDLFLLSVGHGTPPIENNVRHRHLGRIDEDRLLALIYSAADVFVIPSLQEAFGQTALEAMACGTPVVGFDVGGIPDMVRPGVTGLLAPVGDVEGLRGALVALLNDQELRQRMSTNCRQMAVEEFALELQPRRYAALYAEMIE